MSQVAEEARFSPAAERNRVPILQVLRDVLPERARVLEVASGTGQHASYFAEQLADVHWQPTDRDPECLRSIEAWTRGAAAERIASPRQLDVCSGRWDLPAESYDAVFAANMIHIAPFEACLGLLEGAARHLGESGVLVLYGPFRIDGRHTAPSNERFDASLRARDPRWGVRDLETVRQHAEEAGLRYRKRVAMPANNFVVIFQRAPSAS